MNIATIIDFINSKLDSAAVPAPVLSPLLLKCASMTRPGLSPYKITAKIIENNKLIGIPTGPNPDGSSNLINQYTYNVVKCICDALKNDAAVHVSVPMSSLLIETNGANAGGPVVSTGTNILDSTIKGIIQ